MDVFVNAKHEFEITLFLKLRILYGHKYLSSYIINKRWYESKINRISLRKIVLFRSGIKPQMSSRSRSLCNHCTPFSAIPGPACSYCIVVHLGHIPPHSPDCRRTVPPGVNPSDLRRPQTTAKV